LPQARGRGRFQPAADAPVVAAEIAHGFGAGDAHTDGQPAADRGQNRQTQVGTDHVTTSEVGSGR